MKRIVFLLCAAIMIVHTSSAQQIKKYEGAMKLPSDLSYFGGMYSISLSEHKSNGSYQYYENSDGDRIKHGSFYFLSIPIGYPNLSIQGMYSHGKKDGKWVVKLVNDKGEVVMPHLGREYGGGIEVTYKEDSICGEYNYVRGSDVGLYSVISSGNIKNGRVIGKVTVKKIMNGSYKDNTLAKECEMTGEIGLDGMPIGVWTVSDKGGFEKTQRRFFHNGLLVAIDEMDNSTGERILCYCAFEGQKRAPNMQEIRDSSSGENVYIIYGNHVALKVREDESINYNSALGKYSMGNSHILNAAPYFLTDLPGTSKLREQLNSWPYVYSEKKFLEAQEAREKFIKDSIQFVKDSIEKEEARIRLEKEKREKYVQDSIQSEKRKKEYEKQLGEANKKVSDELRLYMSQTDKIDKNHKLKNCEVIKDRLLFYKKLSANASDVTKITTAVVISEGFSEVYMKNSMNQTYLDNDFILEYNAKVLSNNRQDVILLGFDLNSRRHYLLIDKRTTPGEISVYKLEQSAVEKLPFKL